MAALSARDAFGYGARLFGYLLTTTILGGGLVAGGFGLAYTLEPAVLPGGDSPESYAVVAAGGLLAFLGVLVFAAGLFVVALVTITDAVRLGIDHSALGPDQTDRPPEADTEETATDSEPDETPPDRSPAEDQPESEASDDPLSGGSSDPLAGSSDPFAEPESSDPLAGGGSSDSGSVSNESRSEGSNGRRQAGPTQAEDDEAWRREIEAKLDEEDDHRGSAE